MPIVFMLIAVVVGFSSAPCERPTEDDERKAAQPLTQQSVTVRALDAGGPSGRELRLHAVDLAEVTETEVEVDPETDQSDDVGPDVPLGRARERGSAINCSADAALSAACRQFAPRRSALLRC
jgi:hypothetical protein